MSLHIGSKSRLTEVDLPRFVDDTLFCRLARAVCRAGVLPRKELYESWEVARRVHRLLRHAPTAGRRRVFDLACGHGLLGATLLILDRTLASGQGIDQRLPPSSSKLLEVLRPEFAHLEKWTLRKGSLEDADVTPADVVVSCHACGSLTDRVLEKAIAAGAIVAVVPCCHEVPHRSTGHDALAGWLDPTLAIDVERAARLQRAGYAVRTQLIPVDITQKNRLLVGLRDCAADDVAVLG